jgi:hypothetical protein
MSFLPQVQAKGMKDPLEKPGKGIKMVSAGALQDKAPP